MVALTKYISAFIDDKLRDAKPTPLTFKYEQLLQLSENDHTVRKGNREPT